MKYPYSWLLLPLMFLAFVGSIGLQEVNKHTYLNLYDAVRKERFSLPEPHISALASLGYQGFVADLQWLEMIQHIGRNVLTGAYRQDLGTVLESITTLDERFYSAYILGLLLLDDIEPARMHALGIKGIQVFCDPTAVSYIRSHDFESLPTSPAADICQGHHELPTLLGLLTFQQLANPLEAAQWYFIAAHTAGSPANSEQLIGVMLSNSRKRLVALRLWYDLYQGSTDEAMKEYAFKKLTREEHLLTIEDSAQTHYEQTGAWPAQIEELGLPAEVLEDPFSDATITFRYLLNNKGGASIEATATVE